MKTRIPVERFCWIWEDHPPNQALTEDGLCVEVKFRSVMQPAPAVLQMRWVHLLDVTSSARYLLGIGILERLPFVIHNTVYRQDRLP